MLKFIARKIFIHRNPGMKTVVLTFLLISLFGCNSTTSFRKADMIKPHNNKDVVVYGQLDPQLSSQYFGSFEFIFKNLTQRWLSLENVRVTFRDDSARKYINVVGTEQLVQWGKVIRFQNRLKEASFEESILSFGTGLPGISTLLGPAADVLGIETEGEDTPTYPDNHLYAEELVIPPGMMTEKWILFVSQEHQRIPYLRDIFLEFDINATPYETRLIFREKNKRSAEFDWRVENLKRRRFMVSAYLIMNDVDGDQTFGATNLPLNIGFGFPLDSPEFGFHSEVVSNQLGAIFDIASIDVSDDVTIPDALAPDTEGKFDFDIFTWEVLGLYRFHLPTWSFDLMGGLRYKKLRFRPEITADEAMLTDTFKADWFDPIIGGRFLANLSKKIFVIGRGDFGGFGIGSEFTWNSSVGFGYHLTRRTDLTVKLNHVNTRYKDVDDNMPGAFEYDATELRLLLGAAMNF